MKFLSFFVVMLLLLYSTLGKATTDESDLKQDKVKIAISTFAEPSTNFPLIAVTIDALKKEFGPQNVEENVYQLPELEKVLADSDADLFISSSGTFRRFLNTGARSIATIVSNKLSDPNKSEGSAVIVKADRNDLKTLLDIKGKTVATNMPNSFYGQMIINHEIYKKGYDPRTFFGKTMFVGHDAEQIIQKVLTGEADAGILRTCYWEEYAERNRLDKDLVRVIDAKSSNLVCQHTSDLYPNWVIATTKSAAPNVARRSIRAILSVEPTGNNGLYWGLSTDFQPLDQLLKDLEIGPYKVSRTELINSLIRHHKKEIFFGLTLIVLFLLYHFRVQYLVNKRTTLLNEIHQNARDMEIRYNKLQRIGIVGLLSSTVAHEIRQPLGAIQFFAKGLEGNLKKSKNPNETTQYLRVTQKIVEQAQKVDETIKKIRKLANEGQSFQDINIVQGITRLARESLEATGTKNKVKLTIESKQNCHPIYFDVVCFDLVFSNLLRNACEFIANTKDPRLKITVRQNDKLTEVQISNNGPMVDINNLVKKSIPNPNGSSLGFGIPIAMGLIDNVGGKIEYKSNPQGGVAVTVIIPQNLKK